MRREFAEFNSLFPDKSSPTKGVFYHFMVNIRRMIWRKKLKGISVGSESWHKLQQKVSLLSTTEADMIIRSDFFEHSVDCKGKIYVLPNTIMCYPYRIKIGYNVFINRGVYITARANITIGDNVLIGPGVIINSGMHNYMRKDVLIRDQGHKVEPIVIGNDVWIGANAVIMPGVNIADGAVIGAGAVVTRSIMPYEIALGVPAKVVGTRQMDRKIPN